MSRAQLMQMLTQQVQAENRGSALVGGCGSGLVGGFKGERAMRAALWKADKTTALEELNRLRKAANQREYKKFPNPSETRASVLRADLAALRAGTYLCNNPPRRLTTAQLEAAASRAREQLGPYQEEWAASSKADMAAEAKERRNARKERNAERKALQLGVAARRIEMLGKPARKPRKPRAASAGLTAYQQFRKANRGLSRADMSAAWAQHKGDPAPAPAAAAAQEELVQEIVQQVLEQQAQAEEPDYAAEDQLAEELASEAQFQDLLNEYTGAGMRRRMRGARLPARRLAGRGSIGGMRRRY